MSEYLTRAALNAAERGWHVFPLRPNTKRPALHGETACPRTGPCVSGHRKWEERATTDPDRIRAAWAHAPFNVGIATGPSGLLVVDLDVPKDNSNADAPDGAATFEALCERTGQPVPRTRTVRTASGGHHLYFTAPAPVRLHNTAGTLAPLVDTRAWGGYVVAAGSTIDGTPYELEGPALLRPLPDWLKTLLVPPHPVNRLPVAAPAGGRRRPYVASALAKETAAVATAREGQRNATLLRAGRALGRFVASGDLTRTEVEEALQGAGESAGLSAAECRATLRSALDWSIAHNQTRPAVAA
ncbi:Bifunctional DNA primase/polymerase, N-terminal [Streptomyces sp. Ag82_O1-12]|uniref:bifunctional DNA primase/polymerase n=1 Tax=unclassified Streptomyces TaxID=2593676 RepID=UPI000BD43D06|nr:MULTISPECIES: bifunctional DNA primase/polymerase [unclassified Streptomyces]SMQ17476.1 Bifunctional DNA primase/polymerase, N-terminal [Streptomyces sp. Ag82_O1-12]SOD46511.1 Bifunctional DNA primase/polymerase, N-terminal [Streptomyces sp. Ag82_G6-1]